MTEYDDTLIDMPYVEEEEVETSSSEVDDQQPATSETAGVNESATDTSSRRNSSSNNGTATSRGEGERNSETVELTEESADQTEQDTRIRSERRPSVRTERAEETVREETTSETRNEDSNNNINSDNNVREQSQENNMSESARLEEKLRQFKDDNDDNKEDTRGTYRRMSELEKQRRRNLIFDEERFEETFLKCLICREVYNEVDKLPKMLHCHHTFCMDCLQQMYRVEGEFRQQLTGVFRGMPMTVKINCPTCREGIIISEAELRRLPNDHTIMELLCFVSQTGKNEVQYCTKHQMQPLNFFCEPCILPVCCDCTVIDHKESKGHVVVNVDEAMKKYAPIVEETLGEIKCEKAALAEKREALESAQDDLDQIQRNLTTQIRAVFDNIRELLDEREKELYDISDSEIERKREILDGHMKVLMDRDSQLNAQFNELQKAKDDKDISLIFTGHKSAQEVLSNKVHVPTNSTKGFSVTFQFSSRSDSIIKQQIANLGDIIFQS